MIRLITCIGILFGVFILVITGAAIVASFECWVEDQDRMEMQLKIEETMRRLTPPLVASEYYSRIEKASVEILSQKKPVDKIIVLWWGLDGLRLNEDGSMEWISRKKPDKKPDKKPETGPVNQNVFNQTTQSMAKTIHPLDMRNMCQSTRAQIEELQEKIDACKMQNATQSVNAQVVSQIQSPPLQMIYPYAKRYQGNLTGCCCDGSILR